MMNWYYAYYDGAHTTRDYQFPGSVEAFAFFRYYFRNLETVHDCGPDHEDDTVIWSISG
jgi:hypothetical protein